MPIISIHPQEVFLVCEDKEEPIIAQNGLPVLPHQLRRLIRLCAKQLADFSPEKEQAVEYEVEILNADGALWRHREIALQFPQLYAADLAAGRFAAVMATAGFVYLCKDPHTKFTKIGFSKTPVLREKTLQAEAPAVHMTQWFPGTMEDEANLHEEFAEQRMRGEWFDLDEDDVSDIREQMGADVSGRAA